MKVKLTFTQEGKGTNAPLKRWCTVVKWAAALFSWTHTEYEEFAAVSLVCCGYSLTYIVTGVS